MITVARLDPRKGHHRVLHALCLLRDDPAVAPLRYYIVGDGPLRTEIEEEVGRLGLQDIVTLFGSVDDEQLADLYSSSDLFVMPTVSDDIDREGFGTVYIEAAAHGLPSIATDMSGVNEAVLHGQTGLLVQDHDASDLVASLRRLMLDHEFRASLGGQAREHANCKFTSEACYPRLNDLL